MNCREWEERIALYLGGELAGDAAREAERHLGECPGCQVFASGLRETLAVLKEAHQEIPAPPHFAAVRARVLEQLSARQMPWWRRAWVYGLVGAAALAAMLMVKLSPRPLPGPGPGAPVAKILPVPEVLPPLDPAPRHRQATKSHGVPNLRHRVQPVRRIAPPLERPSEPGPPMVVKLLTDDPNVVIYWITDRRGD